MAKVLISYDYDHDLDIKNALVAQSRLDDSPFSIEDWSVKEESNTWRADAQSRISRSGLVIVLCGKNMATASGVNVEIGLAKEVGTDFILLAGRGSDSTRPTAASANKLYDWTWPNLKLLLAGSR
jgi:hypothetical protein